MAERRKKKRPNYIWIPAAVIVVLAVVLLLALGGKEEKLQAKNSVEQGISYLASLEKKDPKAVKQVREEIFHQRMAEQKDQLTQQIIDGEVDPYPLFQDYAVLGDSRAVGFWYYNYLEHDRVFADGGHTIRKIPGWVDTLVALDPSYIYLCYGLNDTSIGYWDSAEAYAQEYVECVQLLQEALPEAKIVVSSILPAQDPAFKLSSRWRRIPDWNVVLEQYCLDNGILYANCDWLHDSFPYYWDPDGIHFRPSLYPYWGGILLVTGLYGGLVYEG